MKKGAEIVGKEKDKFSRSGKKSGEHINSPSQGGGTLRGKILQRLRSVKFDSAARQMSSFAGLRLVFDWAHRLKLVEDLRGLTVKKRQRRIPIEDFVLSRASNSLIGDDSLGDPEVLRRECEAIPTQEAAGPDRPQLHQSAPAGPRRVVRLGV